MNRQERQAQQADEMERQFLIRLLPALEECAVHGTLLFMPAEFAPDNFPEAHISKIACDLLAAADDILKLRSQWGFDVENSLAYRYRQECKASNDQDRPHRLGPRRRAERWLEDLN